MEDWLTPYLGTDGPIWDPHNVEVQGKHVLLFEVLPPRDGDRLHTLRKTFGKWHEGAILIRRKGKTVEANSSEVQMLVARANARAEQLDVDVGWLQSPLLSVLDLRDEDLADHLDSTRQGLLRQLEPRSTVTPRANPDLEPMAKAAREALRHLAKTSEFMEEARKRIDRKTNFGRKSRATFPGSKPERLM